MSREQLKTVNAFIIDTIDHSMRREIDGDILPRERFERRQIAILMKNYLRGIAGRLERKKAVKIRVRHLRDGNRYFTIGRGRRVCYFVPAEAFDHNYPDDEPRGTAV